MNTIFRHRPQRLLKTAAAMAAMLVLYHFLLLPRMLQWGATDAEAKKYYPGDERIKKDNRYANTLAVTVHGTPSDIWPWVAQMGLHKAGFYSYTWLENLFGCKLKNADQLHPDWQHPRVGDIEPVCQSQEGKPGTGWQVGIVEEKKALVWYGRNGAPWMMGVYIDSVNAHESRLIARQQFRYPDKGTLDWLLEKIWFEWAHCIMQRGMLQGIKRRVERADAFGNTRYPEHYY